MAHGLLLRRWPALVGSACLLVAGAAFGQGAACPALLDRSVPSLQDEKPQSLCQYSDKGVLVVNTASACGFPSNDFAGQDPGSNREIAEFCENQFDVRFPMFIKGAVGGTQAQPLYADLRRPSGQAPGWNFHKDLIGRDGRSVRSYASVVEPDDRQLQRDIEALLNVR